MVAVEDHRRRRRHGVRARPFHQGPGGGRSRGARGPVVARADWPWSDASATGSTSLRWTCGCPRASAPAWCARSASTVAATHTDCRLQRHHRQRRRSARPDHAGRGGLPQRVRGRAAHPAGAGAASLPRTLPAAAEPARQPGDSGGLPHRQHDHVGRHREHQPARAGHPHGEPARRSAPRSACASACPRRGPTWKPTRAWCGRSRACGMGIEFSMLDDGARTAIETFVHTHFFTNRKA